MRASYSNFSHSSNPIRHRRTYAIALSDATHAEQTIEALKHAGFQSNQIGVVAMTVPDIGPIVAGGTLASALNIDKPIKTCPRAGITSHHIEKALLQMGISKARAADFKNKFLCGDIILTVSVEEHCLDAISILKECHANFQTEKIF
jgi:hypothetical protein